MACQVRQQNFVNGLLFDFFSHRDLHFANNDISKLDPCSAWVKNAGRDWKFGFKCQSCELKAVQALTMCEHDTN